MRHCKHRKIKGKGLEKGLITAMLKHGSIVTTESRAKLLRPRFEKVLTKVKKCFELNNLVFRRELISNFGEVSLAAIKNYYPHFKDKAGGYTRIVKLESRKGDNAEMAKLSIVGI